MTTEVLRNVMKQVWDSGLVGPQFNLLWHAGEPLAVPVRWYEEAFEVISEFPNADKLVQHSIQSNGILINDKWCEFLKKNKVDIGLSIDGPDFIHDFHRKTRKGEGTHAQAMKGAAKLKEHGIPFGVVSGDFGSLPRLPR